MQAGAFLPARHQETLLHVPCLGRQLLGQCWSQFIVCDISWQCLLCKVPVVLLANLTFPSSGSLVWVLTIPGPTN